MIRAATPFDAPEIYRLSVELHGLTAYADIPICEEKVKKLIAFLIGSPQQYAWVAEKDGVIHGFLLGAVDEIVWSRKKEAHDVWFYVRPQMRGAGFWLARNFLRWARQRNVVMYGISVSSGIDEDRSIAMLERLGLRRMVTVMAARGGQ